MAAVLPMCLQLYLLYWVFIWAERDSAAAAFYPLATTLLMLAAVPIALVANVWMVFETRGWRIYWVMVAGYLQALIIPVSIIFWMLASVD